MLMLPLAVGVGATAAATAQAHDEENEQVTTLDKIPTAARDRLVKEAAGAPITKVEQETSGGKTVYEAHVKTKAGEIAVTVDANGKLISKGREKE
jgi:uncharacterized membrane protein YkoI